MVTLEYQALKAALLWHIDAGAETALSENPKGLLNTALPDPVLESGNKPSGDVLRFSTESAPLPPLGASEARIESVRLALASGTLEELRAAIADFDGISIRATATNMVFCDGNPDAPIMLVGDAPEAEDDRSGKPFGGDSGLLLDRILASIGLDRAAPEPLRSLYISNILNWRPPGNRTPTPAEIDVSLPLIERHIQLIQPKLLILAGGDAAQALLGSSESISRLRGRWHNYLPQTPELRQGGAEPIPVLATFHPSYLLRTPAQKRLVWADMLLLLEKRKSLDLFLQ